MLSYAMGEEEDKDEYEAEAVLAAGFKNVKWEDRGTRDTIFDDFDTLDHFRKVRDIRKIFALTLPGEDYDAEELVMMLHDQHPELLNMLSVTAGAISRATNQDDIAEVRRHISCYVEQLADVLTLSRPAPQDTQRIGTEEFRNRLSAYIDRAIVLLTNSGHRTTLRLTDADHLLEHIDAILNDAIGTPSTPRIFFYLAKISIALLQLGVSSSHGSYSPFSERIYSFSLQCLRDPMPPSA